LTQAEKDTAQAPAETVIVKQVPKGELKLLVILMIMGLAWLFESLKIDGVFQGVSNGPGSIIQLVALALVIMVGSHAYILLKKGHKDGGWQELKVYLFDKQVVILIVMILLYGLLVEFLTFVPTSILFLSITMYLLDRKDLVKKCLISSAFVGTLYLIFSLGFQVVLP
jgi:hypothetical protein